jgi:hypothetical protein
VAAGLVTNSPVANPPTGGLAMPQRNFPVTIEQSNQLRGKKQILLPRKIVTFILRTALILVNPIFTFYGSTKPNPFV